MAIHGVKRGRGAHGQAALTEGRATASLEFAQAAGELTHSERVERAAISGLDAADAILGTKL